MEEKRLTAKEFWDDVRANPDRSALAFWDDFYGKHTWGEQGPVNRHLIAEVEGLDPGTALDLGCGEGWDTFWLAEHGWRVTGADVSTMAIERALARVEKRGLSDRVNFEQHELSTSFPQGQFDLVSAQFLHSPVAKSGERAAILAHAAQAVAPGGHLLIVSHLGMPSWVTDAPAEVTLPSVEETIAALRLAEGEWETLRSGIITAEVIAPDGQPGTRDDHLLHLQRHR